MTFKAGTKMGVWNYIEKIDGTDHINMVGQTQKSTHAMLQAKFFELAKMLNSIPVSSSSDAHICPGARFTDMPSYTNWAHEGLDYCIQNGIMSGTSATTFSPNAPVTRQDMATILYNYAKNVLDLDVFDTADLTGYPDYSSISGYARTAMSWAVAQGLICGADNGMGVVILQPKGDATRAQTAAVIMRFCQNVL